VTSLDVLGAAAMLTPGATALAVLLFRVRALRPATATHAVAVAGGAGALLCSGLGRPDPGAAAVVAVTGILLSLTLVAALVLGLPAPRPSAPRPLGTGEPAETDQGRRDRRGAALAAAVAGGVLASADVTGRLDVLRGDPVPLTVLVPVAAVAWLALLAALFARPRSSSPAAPVPAAVAGVVLLSLVVAAGTSIARDVRPGWPVLALGAVAAIALWIGDRLRGRDRERTLRALAVEVASDPLTGLGNQRALRPAVGRALRSSTGPLHLLTVDLDGFGEVNAGLGHDVGDDVLVAVAQRLRDGCGPVHGEAFRFGGDEFGVLVAGSDDVALTLADELVAAVPGAGAVGVAASVGIARHVPASGVAGADAVRAAMTDLQHSGDAVRAAKAAGRGRVMSWGAPLAQRRVRRSTVLQALRRKIDDGGPELHLQPVVDLETMRMAGTEALARWHDPELGWVPPDEFIRIAEEHGLMDELGRQLLRRSMAAAVSTGAQAAGLFSAINISTLQLRTPGFADRVAMLAQEFGIVPQQYVLEITESAGMDDDDPALKEVLALADLGMPISVDDFGTGYSALAYLNRLPVTYLKLDRVLTADAATPRGHTVARSVTEMARVLGIEVVAEGIETTADLATTREIGARYGQGWLFSRAVPPPRLAEFVADQSLLFAGHPELVTTAR
jgi:diguanylate cyclase (GGDEF)-like protein